MTENQLANIYQKSITKWVDYAPDVITQDYIWELSKTLAKLAQPRKRYQDLHNSVEGRKQRKELMKGN